MRIDDLIKDLQLKKTYLQRESDVMIASQYHGKHKANKELYERKLNNFIKQQDIIRRLDFYKKLRRALNYVIYDQEGKQR